MMALDLFRQEHFVVVDSSSRALCRGEELMVFNLSGMRMRDI